MAILKQKRDGSFCILGPIPGLGFCTWQITEDGVALLERNKIRVGDRVPWNYISALKDQGYVFTGGRGVDPDVIPVTDRATAPTTTALPMRFAATSNGWTLELVLPSLPKALFDKLPADTKFADLLSACTFKLDGHTVVSGLLLWPGKPDARIVVQPHQEPYVVEPEGDWPIIWDLAQWAVGSIGLQPTGTFFRSLDSDCLRLLPGDELIAGETYILVTAARLQFPAGLQHRELPQLGRWNAWEIQAPAMPAADVKSWVLGLGYSLRDPPWKLTLISPLPIGYSARGLPIIEATPEVAVVAQPPEGDHTTRHAVELLALRDGEVMASTSFRIRNTAQSSAAYISMAASTPGEYRLRATKGRVAFFAFQVVEQQAYRPEDMHMNQPAPLTAVFASSPKESRFRAYTDSESDHALRLKSVPTNLIESFQVHCPVPVKFRWQAGPEVGRHTGSAAEVTQQLAADLHGVLSRGQSCQVILEAGCYGHLTLTLYPPQVESADTEPGADGARLPTLPGQVIHRAHWLAQSLPAFPSNGEPLVRLPLHFRAKLARLDALLEGTSFSEWTFVPLVFWPHLRSLVLALQMDNLRAAGSSNELGELVV